MPLERITVFCFAASYAVALALELFQLLRPRPIQRWLITGFGFAGLLAQTLFLSVQHPSLSHQYGSLLFLSWILAIFYLYGSVHHRQVAWGVFVLPLLLGLILLAEVFGKPATATGWLDELLALESGRFWRVVHIALFLLASVGICVAFLASIMYLLQAHRLKTKALPGRGLRLLSLERLEAMNRRAIILSFPLLTVGLLVSLVLLLHGPDRLAGWTDPRVLTTVLLWLLFGVVLYLRYGYRLRGRSVAWLTIMAFGLLLVTWVTSHSFAPGGGP
jgi:ABC-type transport system involved in cytochrome c biogenesis permease subunit